MACVISGRWACSLPAPSLSTTIYPTRVYHHGQSHKDTRERLSFPHCAHLVTQSLSLSPVVCVASRVLPVPGFAAVLAGEEVEQADVLSGPREGEVGRVDAWPRPGEVEVERAWLGPGIYGLRHPPSPFLPDPGASFRLAVHREDRYCTFFFWYTTKL